MVAGIALSALTAVGLNAVVSKNETSTTEIEQAPKSETVHVEVFKEVNDDDWGHTTAENLIMYAVGKGSAEAIAKLNPNDTETTPEDIAELASALAYYDETNHALELASKDGTVVLQPGQELSLEVDVTVTENAKADADQDYVITYEVTDAEYHSPSDAA